MRLVLLLVATALTAGQHVTLQNAVESGLKMPWIGLGTGGYGAKRLPAGEYPECWGETHGCGPDVVKATREWLSLGGRRLDMANTYDSEASVAQGLQESGVARSEVFVLEKIGPSQPLGYQDAHQQFNDLLARTNFSYVDALLIHWPEVRPGETSLDPHCNMSAPDFSAKTCRLRTWKALVEIHQSGRARSIGVSNYNATHLQEIVESGMIMPSINQCPFHLYHSRAQQDTIDFGRKHGVTFLAYSPLGIPDWHQFPKKSGMASTPLMDPVVTEIASNRSVTPAQVLLAWEWQLGIPMNPRTMNVAHMRDNLGALHTGRLSQREMDLLLSRHQDTCDEDPTFYECMQA